ncbi:MAG TPA: neutral zinc metallopeptidase [Ornithinimicrobium sp.]|uniref:KPN_02809 family neutral zinc metallopeptidase n=1 Tax=Ornithinimicrobium sp. TaxID=1977084 RepID=UPI002B459FDB|nr:neutral zinc metallopeptidase [Ornithinimicrobium sp.]HKJ12927.1 neutral zinc metallopeptidase [Ornithinimicrobium sp.]
MTFRENADLRTGQVRRGGGRRRAGGSLAAGGGAGGVLLLVLYLVFGGGIDDDGDGGVATGSAWDYDAGYVGEQGGGGTSSGAQFPQCRTGQDANERLDCRMVGTVISVQDYWASAYRDYRPAETVLFDGSVNTACGAADSSVGPFYCPVDSSIYLDVSFFRQLERMGADGGSLSQMYVVAHEYGHHIQNLTGTLAAGQRDQTGPDSGAVRVELQADCYAGVWVAHASQTTDDSGRPLLEPITAEQVESALSAAEAVGDDRIQQQAQGRVDPDVWTHGSAEQRQHWFTTGYDSGDPRSCDTFDRRSP